MTTTRQSSPPASRIDKAHVAIVLIVVITAASILIFGAPT